ncbi:aminopeptidase P N-terminal domain-containing protein [Candidatus Saccharibacteria bacterium]|jgi:Xaa-Pro aminopeptidase|nr:aminopeptidase P N-terminal domain-containing protein [Candidatus Saccharibacteria bacterium]
MQSHFSPHFFAGNRQKLRQLLPPGTVTVLTASGTLQRSGDTTFPFSQDRNFWYMTGLDAPDILLVLDQNQEYLVLPKSDPVRDVFDGAIDTEYLSTRSVIDKIYTEKEGWARLKKQLHTKKHVATIVPGSLYSERSAMYQNPARRRLMERLRRISNGAEFTDIRQQIAKLRAVKQSAELNAIASAVHITTATVNELRSAQKLGTYDTEYGLEAAITFGFRKRGAAGHAYSPIIASGKNATTLHYVANSAPLNSSELIVVDVGAEVEHYAADITRTLCSSVPTKRQAAVLAAVESVQEQALEALKPGTLLKEYEQVVATAMGRSLVSLGLCSDPTDHALLRRYYPHATSHFLGLDVHDVGDYREPLVPGMVLTCEPGIYIPEEGIGVRLEDDIVITKTGYENLSADCSHSAYVL